MTNERRPNRTWPLRAPTSSDSMAERTRLLELSLAAACGTSRYRFLRSCGRDGDREKVDGYESGYEQRTAQDIQHDGTDRVHFFQLNDDQFVSMICRQLVRPARHNAPHSPG